MRPRRLVNDTYYREKGELTLLWSQLGSLQFLLVMTMAMLFAGATGMFDVGLDLEEEANKFNNTSANPQI